jgi:hypothetical protein
MQNYVIGFTKYSNKQLYTCKILGSHSGNYEEFSLLGYNAVLSVEIQRMFRKNISPPSSGRRISRVRNHAALLAICFHTGFLPGLFFDPEYVGDMFLRNVG